MNQARRLRQASLRDASSLRLYRGLKPTAAIIPSLREEQMRNESGNGNGNLTAPAAHTGLIKLLQNFMGIL